jgi:hypothetical protein
VLSKTDLQRIRGWKLVGGKRVVMAKANRVQMAKWAGWSDSEVQLVGRKDWSSTTLADPGSRPLLILTISHFQFDRYCSFYPGGDYELYENLGTVSVIHLTSDMTIGFIVWVILRGRVIFLVSC